MRDSTSRRRFIGKVTALMSWALGAGVVWAQSPPLRRTPTGDLLETVARGDLPPFAKQGGPRVAEAYRYAAASEATLQYIPCYCGCTNIGHRHNGDCYVAGRHSDGRITFTSHGAG